MTQNLLDGAADQAVAIPVTADTGKGDNRIEFLIIPVFFRHAQVLEHVCSTKEAAGVHWLIAWAQYGCWQQDGQGQKFRGRWLFRVLYQSQLVRWRLRLVQKVEPDLSDF